MFNFYIKQTKLILNGMGVFTIAASSLAAISICSIFIISVSAYWIKSLSISSNFWPDDVIGNAPDVTWNSNWPTGKSFYSYPGGLLENPAALHGKPCMKGRSWMGLLGWNSNIFWYMYWDLRRWSRCSCQRRCCYSNRKIIQFFYHYINLTTWIIHFPFF